MKRMLVVVLVVVAIAGVPDALLELATRRARACFARIEERGLEDCGAQAGALRWLLRVPWTARRAELVGEEIAARMAAVRYLDAAVGDPDGEALAARFADLAGVRRRVVAGSGRLSLDLLGPRMGVPEPDALAERAGDRQALLRGGDGWVQHHARSYALDAALLEGRLERAVELARRYADTSSAAVRLRAAALLCAGGAPGDGLRVAAAVEQERADERQADIVAHFGGARVVVEACAGLAGKAPPKLSYYGHAGDWDQRVRVMALRLRRLGCDERPCAGELEQLRELSRTKHAAPHRLELVALLGEGRLDESDLVGRIPEVVDDFVTRRDDAPFVGPERWEGAAEQVDGRTAAAMRVQALIGYALRGDLAAADRLLERLHDQRYAARLGAAAALVTGDRNEARRRIEAAPPEDAAAQLLRAELYLPDRQAARAAAERALRAAERQKNARLTAAARWLLLALGATVSDAAPPPRVPQLGRGEPRLSPVARARDLDEVLATWQLWLAAPSRAVRWRAFWHGGDAPDALAAYLFAAGALMDGTPSDAHIETWLDAVLAQDVRRFSLRRYALARWRAASWRAAESAAERWRRRFVQLAQLAEEPATAELMHASRL